MAESDMAGVHPGQAVVAQAHLCSNGLPPLEDDRKFHHRLAKMSGNGALVRIITALFDERHNPISAHLSKHSENSSTWDAAVIEHEAILRAVASRDVLGAQTSIREHLRRSENRWLQALEPEKSPPPSGAGCKRARSLPAQA